MTAIRKSRLATGKDPDAPRATAIPEADQVIVKELQARWTYARQEWDPIHEEGRTDIRYLTGQTWDQRDLNARVGRLSLEFDQLNQYRNQLVNSIRQSPIAIKITPEGNGANDQTATVRADRIRQIEYLSNAQEAYTAAFEGATDRSYGYARIIAEWEPKGFKKQLRIRPVPNPDQVLPDPDAQSITGADWKYLFYSYDMSRDEFKRDYPDATFHSYSQLSKTDLAAAADWQKVDRVQVAEYWTVTQEMATLVRLSVPPTQPGAPPTTVDVFDDQRTAAQKLLPVIQERDAERPVVCMYLTNGVELLAKKGKPKRTEWKGSRIPFKACYGRIVYTSEGTTAGTGSTGTARRQILSYIRLARSAQKYYNYLKSSEGERLKMNLLVPYFAYQGQLTPEQLTALQSSVHTPVPVVLANPTTEKTGDTVLPLPRREAASLDLQEYEIAAEAARRDIANAMGRSSIGDPRRGNARVDSGVGLQELQKSGDVASYNFVDAYKAMIAAIGEDLEELLPFYDDTAGEISTRTASGAVKMVPVNDPSKPDSVDMTQGTHATTVSTGPAIDSERMEASQFADQLIGSPLIDKILGPLAPKFLALAIKLKNVGPIGDEMAEMLNPADTNSDPKAAAQHLQQAMGQLQQSQAIIQKMHGMIESKQQELDAKQKIADQQDATERFKITTEQDVRIKVAEIGFASATTVADIKADLAQTQQLMETQLRTVQGLIDAHQAQLDRMQETGLAMAGHAAAAQSQDSAQQASADAQDSSQAHASELAQTPPPVDPNAQPPAGGAADGSQE